VAKFWARGGAPTVGVLRLEVEARQGTASAASEQRRNHGTGERNPAGGGSTILKGGRHGHNGGGSGEVGRHVDWLEEGALAPTGGDSSGGAARVSGAGLLTSGAQMEVGGRG
jgi:hypothetical protein